MARILHIADLHLDAPFTSRLTVKQAKLRRSEQLETFSKIMKMAKAKADVVLIAGDLFDGENVRRETLSVLSREFEALNGIPVFISAGNHDPHPIYEKIDLGENVHVFPKDGAFYDLDELELRICGASFGSKYESDMISPREFEKHVSYANILVMHGDITGTPGSERYNPISEDQLAGFDYAALGHIHRRIGQTLWAYPGIPEPRGFDETDTGGVIIGDVNRGEVNLNHISTAKRRYCVEEVNMPDIIADNESVINQVGERIREIGEGNIFRIILNGTRNDMFTLGTDLIADRLRPLCFYLEIIDETERAVDLTAPDGDNSLRTVFIRLMNKKAHEYSDDSREYAIVQRALRLGIEAMEGRDSL